MTPEVTAWFDQVRGVFTAHPWVHAPLFIAASLMLVWSLERMARHGLEGTALGTIAMLVAAIVTMVLADPVLTIVGLPGSRQLFDQLKDAIETVGGQRP